MTSVGAHKQYWQSQCYSSTRCAPSLSDARALSFSVSAERSVSFVSPISRCESCGACAPYAAAADVWARGRAAVCVECVCENRCVSLYHQRRIAFRWHSHSSELIFVFFFFSLRFLSLDLSNVCMHSLVIFTICTILRDYPVCGKGAKESGETGECVHSDFALSSNVCT